MNKMPSWIIRKFLIALIVGLNSGCAREATPTPIPIVTLAMPAVEMNAIAEQLDQLVPSVLGEYNVPGAAVSLVLNGEVVWSAGYGLADRAQGIPVTPDTVFQVGSISKAVTSWGVMRLVENGQLDLDAPVEQYLTRWHLPPSDYNASGVTIRRLLSHTAGLSLHGYPGLPPDGLLPSLEESLNGINGGVGPVFIMTEPGSQYSYSGGGYTLLQLVIEEVTGEPFATYMQRTVLEPLGMFHSSFEWRSDLRPVTSVAYSETGAPLPNYLFTEQAAAGLYTTATDLARFVAAEMTGPNGEPPGQEVLTPDTLALMFTPVLQSYGLGHGVYSRPDMGKVIGHGGSNNGWKASFTLFPITRVGVVILTNSNNGMDLINDVMNAVEDQINPPVLVDPQVLAAYAGKYQFPEGVIVTVRVDGTRIFIQAPNRPEYELYARSENQFYSREFDAEFTFYKNASGEVDRLVLVQSGVTYELKKVP